MFLFATLFVGLLLGAYVAADSAADINYASVKAGALILESSAGAKGYDNLLNSDKDKYGITECANKEKWVVIGLSEYVLIRSVVITSYEKYSSLVKDFQILSSMNHPVTEWHDYGTYTAKPILGSQTFNLTTPGWGRYLKLKFLSEYGDEHYCTVSQISVHGSAAMETLQQDIDLNDLEVQVMENVMTQLGVSEAGAGDASEQKEEGLCSEEDASLCASAADEAAGGAEKDGAETASYDQNVEEGVSSTDIASVNADDHDSGTESTSSQGSAGSEGVGIHDDRGAGETAAVNQSVGMGGSADAGEEQQSPLSDPEKGSAEEDSSQPSSDPSIIIPVVEIVPVALPEPDGFTVINNDSITDRVDGGADEQLDHGAGVGTASAEDGATSASGVANDKNAADLTLNEGGIVGEQSSVQEGDATDAPAASNEREPSASSGSVETSGDAAIGPIVTAGLVIEVLTDVPATPGGDLELPTEVGREGVGNEANRSEQSDIALEDDAQSTSGSVLEEASVITKDESDGGVSDNNERGVAASANGSFSSAPCDSVEIVERGDGIAEAATTPNRTAAINSNVTSGDAVLEGGSGNSTFSSDEISNSNSLTTSLASSDTSLQPGASDGSGLNEQASSFLSADSSPLNGSISSAPDAVEGIKDTVISRDTKLEDKLICDSTTGDNEIDLPPDGAQPHDNKADVSIVAEEKGDSCNETDGVKTNVNGTGGPFEPNCTTNSSCLSDALVKDEIDESLAPVTSDIRSTSPPTEESNSSELNNNTPSNSIVLSNDTLSEHPGNTSVRVENLDMVIDASGQVVNDSDSPSSAPSSVPSNAQAVLAAQSGKMKGLNLSCIDNLRFSDFRDKMMAKLQDSTENASSSNLGSAPPGSQDSVFKPLILKIKKLEMKNLINEMYTNQIGDCYRSIFADILYSWGPNGSMTATASEMITTLNEAIDSITARTSSAASVLNETVTFVEKQQRVLKEQSVVFDVIGPALVESNVIAPNGSLLINEKRFLNGIGLNSTCCDGSPDGIQRSLNYITFLFKGTAMLDESLRFGDHSVLVAMLFMSCLLSALSLLLVFALFIYVFHLRSLVNKMPPSECSVGSAEVRGEVAEQGGTGIRRRGFFLSP